MTFNGQDKTVKANTIKFDASFPGFLLVVSKFFSYILSQVFLDLVTLEHFGLDMTMIPSQKFWRCLNTHTSLWLRHCMQL